MANITRRQEGAAQPMTRGWSQWDPMRRMRELLEWDPFAEMAPYERGVGAEFMPRFEVKETKDAYVFRGDLPGIKEEELDIALTGNRLTVSGKRECEERKEDERFFAYECQYGSFTRAFTLPEGIDTEHANAELKNGVLMITVPKRPEMQPRKISLKGGGPAKVKA